MTKIYLVSKGEYSDYRIVAAFSKEADAKLCVAGFTGPYDHAEVEEYTLDEGVDELRQGRHFFVIHRDNEGKDSVEADSIAPESWEPFKVWEPPKPNWPYSWIQYVSQGWFKSEQQALKVASERIARYKAETGT